MTTTDPSPAKPGLAASSMSGFEVLAQSVAAIAPSAVMATGPALVALNAGSSIMYSYLASTAILIMVGWCVTQFTKTQGTGTMLSYITSALGPTAGFLGSVGLAFGYLFISVSCLAGFTLYVSPLLTAVGVPGVDSLGMSLFLMIACVSVAGVAMTRGIQLSTRIGMVLEIASILAIVVVVAAVLGQNGLSLAPLRPEGLGIGSITGGMVLAILGYVGFESAANMGTEAKAAVRTIPRAVMLSVAIAGLLYLLSSYAQLVGFGDGASIAASATPFNDLAAGAGVGTLGYLIDFGAAASFFACVTGSLNAAARLLFQMGGSSVLHTAVGSAHHKWQTPHIAIGALSVVAGLIAVGMRLAGNETVAVFAIAGTIGTYGYMVAYILIAIGVAIYLRTIGSPFVTAAVIGGVAALGMLFVLWRNVYPVPPAPYNTLPWIFLAVLLVAGAWYAFATLRDRSGVVDLTDLDDGTASAAPAEESIAAESSHTTATEAVAEAEAEVAGPAEDTTKVKEGAPIG